MLSEALSYPRRGEDWLKTIGIGGVLLLFGFLLVPTIPVQGYLLRVARSGALGEETPPSFENWGELFVDGFKLFVVLLAYTLVPYVVLVVGGLLGSGEGGGIGSLLGLLVLLAGVALLTLGAYLVPVALTNFALEGRLGAAFEVETVFHAALPAGISSPSCSRSSSAASSAFSLACSAS